MNSLQLEFTNFEFEMHNRIGGNDDTTFSIQTHFIFRNENRQYWMFAAHLLIALLIAEEWQRWWVPLELIPAAAFTSASWASARAKKDGSTWFALLRLPVPMTVLSGPTLSVLFYLFVCLFKSTLLLLLVSILLSPDPFDALLSPPPSPSPRSLPICKS